MFALRRGARALTWIAAVTMLVLLAPGGPAVPQDRPGVDRNAKVRERKQQFALKQLDMIESELLEVQAQLRKARIAILLARELLKEKHGEALEEMLRNDPEARRLRAAIDDADKAAAVYRERSPSPEHEPGYHRLLMQSREGRAHLAKRRDVLLQQLVEKTPVDDVLGKERAVQLRVDHLRKAEEFLSAEWENRLKTLAAMP